MIQKKSNFSSEGNIRVIKYLMSSFSNDNRDLREVNLLVSLKLKVLVCDIRDQDEISFTNNYEIHSRKKKYSKSKFLRKFQIFFNIIIYEPNYLRKKKADIISCHDLIALLIGYISTLFIRRKNKPLLIYDSHEFELGRNTNGKRSKLTKFLIRRLEHFLIKRCVLSIMVNDTIADEVMKIHNLDEKPLVVRNVPNYWHIDEGARESLRKSLLDNMKHSKSNFIMMYHGVIMPGRGIEKLLDVIQCDSTLALIILGNGNDEYIGVLKELVASKKIEENVMFHNAVSYDELWKYVSAVDVGMVTIPAVSKSYYYMLPNKFFENIQAETPIICSNFPEVSKIVNKYEIGICVNPNDTKEIYEAVLELKKNQKRYKMFKENLLKAKKDLNWETESLILKEAYKKVIERKVK